mmetsp:Transcript_37042/g.41276  ORF Transcript_37042/g.41276 Transcript_37042/m.41276 type:complete len:105 (+) Transcript_37042:40-354(+)
MHMLPLGVQSKNTIKFHITRGSIIFQLWIQPANALVVVLIPENMGVYQKRRNNIEERANAWEKKKKTSQWTPTQLGNLEEVIEDDPDLLVSRRDSICFWELGQG